MTRRNFTPAIIKRRLEHAGHQCEAKMADGTRCLVKAERGRFHADHDNPDGLTGEPTFENCRILCLAHHAEKTARDQANIAKAKRNEASHLGLNARGPLAGADAPTRAARKNARSNDRAGGKISVPPARQIYVRMG